MNRPRNLVGALAGGLAAAAYPEMTGIWETCVKAVEGGDDLSIAKSLVLRDPRVSSRATRTAGFEANIGKYTSLAYLEAEKVAF